MRKTLTLTASLYFLGICASYFGFLAPVAAQDPQTIFGSDKAPPAATLPKAGASGKKVPAANPAATAPAKAAAAAQSKTAAAAPTRPAAEQQAKAAAMAPAKPAAAHAKPHAKPVAAQAEPDTATATSQPSSTDAMAPAATAEPSEPAKAEVNTLTKTGAKAGVKTTPKPHSTAAAGPRPGPSPSHGPRVSGPPPASPAQVRNYCGKLWNKIQNNWDLATGKNHVILGVDVDASGNVTGTQASSQPKNADAETKAQAALTKSQPLEALPAGLPLAHLTITFDSTADPHGDSNSGGSVRLEYNPGASSGATIPVNSPAPSAPASPTTSK